LVGLQTFVHELEVVSEGRMVGLGGGVFVLFSVLGKELGNLAVADLGTEELAFGGGRLGWVHLVTGILLNNYL
jgi:hypothetical protein